MSSEEEAAVAVEDICCANCGVSAIDDIKLKDCDNCDLVKYCSDVCQNNHRDQHDEECKQRAAEIRDIDLFTQPDESHLGDDCPICCLPLPIDLKKSTFMSCCSKIICDGCNVANKKREIEAGLEERCAFCRETAPRSQQEAFKRIMKRAKKNDPAAMRESGKNCIDEEDYETVFEYLTKAAELGDTAAHYNLSIMYRDEVGAEKDMKKQVYHSEEAAIGGHPGARHNLGCIEADNGRFERARKHWIIAAKLGYHDSLEGLRQLYANGYASKEDYADALRAYQAALDATKSAERERAGEAIKNGEIKRIL